MRRYSILLLVVSLAGCGAQYAADADLPNPQSAPLAGVCAPCSVDGDCGPGAYCAAEGDGPPQFCTAPCDSAGACPEGQTCFDLGNGLSGCYPSSQTCQQVVTGPTGGAGGETTGDGSTASSTTGTTGTAASSTTGTAASSTTGTAASSTTGSHGSSSSSTGGGASTGTGGSTGNSCTPDTWATTMHSFFNQYCNSCHNFGSVSAVRSEASLIKSRIQSGSMPQRATLTSAQKNAVITWINCGEP